MLKKLIGETLFSEICKIVPYEFLTEIRLRLNMPIAVKNRSERFYLKTQANKAIIDTIIARATHHSLYAYQHEMAMGYIHVSGGIRLGLAGRVVYEKDKITAFKDISSLNIRIPHEIIDCSLPLVDILQDFKNTIIIAPPFAGKTTLIRDMARVLSNYHDLTVIDEREEIAGREGTYKLGKLCDVISGVPKALAYEGIIRSLSPEIIVLDELFPLNDLKAVQEIARSGVKFLASLHGDSIENFVKTSPDMASLFSYAVLLGTKPKVGSIKSIVKFN
jgi:stage III sporulation protein AA